ncbi:MAG: Gfo/Idh/MocA family oxidoreductase [Methanomicrobiales archaeon]|nr:Gfo/Idh/MocA family oxidoreductase [Methanomicrobiales archaeon]
MDVGVIGTGQMGKNHVRVYSELKEVNNLYVYDLNQDASIQVAKEHDAESVQSLEELSKKVDAVSLCVPTPFHFKTVMEVLKYEINTLIEKPICQTSEEGRALLQNLPADLTIGVGHIERFNPIVSEIKNIISHPLYVEFKRHNPASARMTGSSVVEDLMIHDIDIVMHCLFSDRIDITARGSDDVAAALGSCEGATVYLSASRKASKKIRMIHIEQEDMTIQGDFMTQEIYVYRKPGQYSIENQRYIQENIVEKVQVAKQEPLRTELSTFLACVRNNKPFPITPEQALMNLCMCEDIRKAMNI